MGAKVGGTGLPGPCPTASGNVGGLRPALPLSETIGLSKVPYHSPSIWFPVVWWPAGVSWHGEGSFLPADSLTVLEGYRVPLMGGWPGLFDSAGVPATGAGASNAGSLGLFGNRPTLDYLDSGRVADLLRDSVKGILLREPAVASSFPRSLVTEEVVAGMGCARSLPDSAKSFAS